MTAFMKSCQTELVKFKGSTETQRLRDGLDRLAAHMTSNQPLVFSDVMARELSYSVYRLYTGEVKVKVKVM